MLPTCPLCDKLNRLHELPADELVWQFPHSVAFLGPWQFYTGYCVLVARQHYPELHVMPSSQRAVFLDEMVVLTQAIDFAFQPRKMNLESLGNQVAHLHWHLFPRRADDPETRKAVWIALDRAERDEAEKQRLQAASLARTEIASRIRAALNQMAAPTP
ncbi:MAG: HIT family protein [Planctomycetes bacterium]|jgi:diadenosine tetraphosphate (Ap4A) HIT family hydrolase|nr:HIT family protein [Planctomycetota bacterium]